MAPFPQPLRSPFLVATLTRKHPGTRAAFDKMYVDKARPFEAFARLPSCVYSLRLFGGIVLQTSYIISHVHYICPSPTNTHLRLLQGTRSARGGRHCSCTTGPNTAWYSSTRTCRCKVARGGTRHLPRPVSNSLRFDAFHFSLFPHFFHSFFSSSSSPSIANGRWRAPGLALSCRATVTMVLLPDAIVVVLPDN